jgi:hypothetical protein
MGSPEGIYFDLAYLPRLWPGAVVDVVKGFSPYSEVFPIGRFPGYHSNNELCIRQAPRDPNAQSSNLRFEYYEPPCHGRPEGICRREQSDVCLFENGYRDLNNLDLRSGFDKSFADGCIALNNGSTWLNFSAQVGESYGCPGIVVSEPCKAVIAEISCTSLCSPCGASVFSLPHVFCESECVRIQNACAAAFAQCPAFYNVTLGPLRQYGGCSTASDCNCFTKTKFSGAFCTGKSMTTMTPPDINPFGFGSFGGTTGRPLDPTFALTSHNVPSWLFAYVVSLLGAIFMY